MVETLFYGNMIVSTKVGLSMEILSDEFLIDDFKIANKISEIYDEKENYTKRFLQFKQRDAKRFLLENVIHDYLEYYQRIVKEA